MMSSLGVPGRGRAADFLTLTVAWTRQEEDEFVKYCKSLLNFKALKDLEMRARSGTGTESLFHEGQSCCGAQCSSSDHKAEECDKHKHHWNPDTYKIKKNEDDEVGAVLDSLLTLDALRDVAGEVAEKSASILKRILKKAKDENGGTATEEEIFAMSCEILKESLLRVTLSKATKIRMQSQMSDSKEGGLLATPAGYRDGPLDFLRNETLASLSTKGFAVQDGFMGDEIRKKILREVELIEFDGQLLEVGPRLEGSKSAMRSDRICWIKQSALDREKHAGLLSLCQRLSALPFELNKKMRLFCQVATIFQISIFPSNDTAYAKHLDSGYTENTDNGRKITIQYFPNDPDWEDRDGAAVKIHPRISKEEQKQKKNVSKKTMKGKENNDEESSQDEAAATSDDQCPIVQPKGDRLLIFKSRDVPFEVLSSHRKRFAITSWISGPQEPE